VVSAEAVNVSLVVLVLIVRIVHNSEVLESRNNLVSKEGVIEFWKIDYKEMPLLSRLEWDVAIVTIVDNQIAKFV